MTLFEGIYQVAPLVQGTDFAFYGAAIDSGGTQGPGDLYRITSTGAFEVLSPSTVPTAVIQPAA